MDVEKELAEFEVRHKRVMDEVDKECERYDKKAKEYLSNF